MNSRKISEIRKEYPPKPLHKEDLSANPFEQFHRWLNDAIVIGEEEPNAMILATATLQGRPSTRTVLLKNIDASGLVFFTNYASRKAKELEENPFASATFFWGKLGRQIIVEGGVEKVSVEESREYFKNRPRGSQLGSWVSVQGDILPSRKLLEEKLVELEKQFSGKEVPLPPFWGGFRVKPVQMEFWQGQPNRLHDRFRYRLVGISWELVRLSP